MSIRSFFPAHEWFQVLITIPGIIPSLRYNWVWSCNQLWPMRNARGSQQLPERGAGPTLPHLLPLTNVQIGRRELRAHLGQGDLAHTWWNIRKERAWVLVGVVDQSHHTRPWLPDLYVSEKLNATLSAPPLRWVCSSQPHLLLGQDEDAGQKVYQVEESFKVDWQIERNRLR